jgi:hypothetical protein
MVDQEMHGCIIDKRDTGKNTDRDNRCQISVIKINDRTSEVCLLATPIAAMPCGIMV